MEGNKVCWDSRIEERQEGFESGSYVVPLPGMGRLEILRLLYRLSEDVFESEMMSNV